VGKSVIPYKPTWLDKNFKKDLEALDSGRRSQCLGDLADLISGLQRCTHPVLDPVLARWRPSPYKGVVKVAPGCHLAEYRLTGTMRVIACYFDIREDILLLTATVRHDHERMKRLLREHGRSFPSY
jgi:hypothetical protein